MIFPAKIEAEMEKSNIALCGATFGEVGLPGLNRVLVETV